MNGAIILPLNRETPVNASLVLTIIGPDQPGLVESVAQTVAAHGGNWLESRMAHLANQFAGIVHVQVPTENVAALQAALASLDSQNLTVIAATSEDDNASPCRRIELELVGQDRAGIVRDISHAIAAHGINVDELHTECTEAPMSGEILFKANAKLRVPEGVSLDALRADLEKLAHDLLVEIELVDPVDG